jgi:hypothetical protein
MSKMFSAADAKLGTLRREKFSKSYLIWCAVHDYHSQSQRWLCIYTPVPGMLGTSTSLVSGSSDDLGMLPGVDDE